MGGTLMHTGTHGTIPIAGICITASGIHGITMTPGITVHGTARGSIVHGIMIPGTTGLITTMDIMAGTDTAADTVTGFLTVLPG